MNSTRIPFCQLRIQASIPVQKRALDDVRLLFCCMMNWACLPRDTELHLKFVSMSEMTTIHESMKSKKGPTDILAVAGSGSRKDEERWLNELLNSSEIHAADESWLVNRISRKELTDLGDIYICPQYFIEKSKRYPTRCLQTDVYFLSAYIHSFLHVLGFDHVTEAQFKQMARAERNLGMRVKRAILRGEVPAVSRFLISCNSLKF